MFPKKGKYKAKPESGLGDMNVHVLGKIIDLRVRVQDGLELFYHVEKVMFIHSTRPKKVTVVSTTPKIFNDTFEYVGELDEFKQYEEVGDE